MSIQQRNDELVDILLPDFQHRNEPNFAWKSAVSALQFIPGTIAIWPTSIVRRANPTDRVRDIGGGGYHLETANTPDFGYANLVPYMNLDGVNQYAFRAAAAGSWAAVTGTETHILAAQQGLTLGGWYWLDDTPGGGGMGLLAKDLVAGNERSYGLVMLNTRAARFHVSNNGAAISPIGSSNTVLTDEWFFAVGRFDNAGNTIAVNLNGTWTSAVYNNTIFDSTTAFEMGRFNAGNYLEGRMSISFLSSCALSDSIVSCIYEQTRAMFGV